MIRIKCPALRASTVHKICFVKKSVIPCNEHFMANFVRVSLGQSDVLPENSKC